MPNSEYDAGPSTATNPFGGTVVGGALAAVLADASDATYYQMDAGFMQLNVTAWTSSIPAGSQIRYVDFVVRHDYHAPATQPTYSVYSSGYLAQNLALPEALGTGLGDVVIGPFSTDGNGNSMTIASVASNLSLEIDKSGASVIKVAKVTMRVFYNAPPSAPTVTLDLDDLATVAILYTDTELDALESIQVAIFTDAVKTGGGFDPATSTAVYRSGTTYVSAASGQTVVHATGQRILTTGTYWAYARVSDAGSGGRFSAWGNDSKVATINEPSPVVIATDDPVNGCVVLRILGQANQSLDDSFESGSIAVGVTGATAVRSTDHAADGTWSMKATIDPGQSTIQVDANQNSADLDLGYGVPWTFGVSIWPVGSGKTAYVLLAYNGPSGGGLIPAAPVLAPLTAGQWNRLTITGTPPVDARTMVWQVFVSGATGDVVYFDKFSHHPGSTDAYAARNANWFPQGSGTDRWVLQRSDDGGTTWVDVPRIFNVPELASGALLTSRGYMLNAVSQATQIVLGRDFEAPRGKTVQYRARLYQDNAASPGGSPWGTVTSIATNSARSTWLKDPLNPANNWHGYVDDHIKATQEEVQEVHRVLDAPRPVVVSGPLMGDVLGGRFLALSDAKRDQIKALRALQRTLLLQARDGRQWWCRLGPLLDVEPTDDMDPPLWALDFTAVEVAVP